MHLVDEGVYFTEAATAVGDSVALAVGAALAYKLDGSGRVAVSTLRHAGHLLPAVRLRCIRFDGVQCLVTRIDPEPSDRVTKTKNECFQYKSIAILF